MLQCIHLTTRKASISMLVLQSTASHGYMWLLAAPSTQVTSTTKRGSQQRTSLQKNTGMCCPAPCFQRAEARLFSTQGISTWVLQQDNEPTHSVAGAEVKGWNHKHCSNVQLLENWPPNSPDLNLIENVWGLVQEKVNAAAGCSSFDEFKLEVEAQFQAVPKTMLRNLFASMPKRLAKLIELGGGKTIH